MSEKYLIFGATGSIGSNLAEQLKSLGHDIHLVARNEEMVSTIANFELSKPLVPSLGQQVPQVPIWPSLCPAPKLRTKWQVFDNT